MSYLRRIQSNVLSWPIRDMTECDPVSLTDYALFGLRTFFTARPKEVRAWTVPVGATASQAAGVIHTDFERGFIRAEVIAYADYVACKGEQGRKRPGRCGWKARTTSCGMGT